MHSILSKFVVLTVSALLFLSVALGGFSLYITNKITKEDSVVLMQEACKQKAQSLDFELASIEQSVLTIEEYAQYHLKDYQQLYNKAFAKTYCDDICELAVNIAEHTPGAMAVYMRYNPELAGDGKGGFFWSKKAGDNYFTYEPPTDILQYDADDIEHVGWYYVPIQKKEFMWMDPYFNKNLNILMISFVVPFFVGNQLVGVLGMDIDFSLFIDIAQNISLYNSGFAEIASISTNRFYYRDKNNSDRISSDIIPPVLYNDLLPAQEPGYLLEYNHENYKDKLCVTYQSLRNSMRIIVVAPKNEINAERNALIHYIVFLSFMVLLVGIIVTVLFAGRITKPLQDLTIAANHYRHGQWNYQVDCKTKDEVYTLTETMKKMAEETQSYISQINDMAYKDALTGVKNKASYIKYVDELKGSNIDYAVVIIDINELKTANDTYGHDTGDILIIDSCRLICHVFIHSPVFRIGGDEFCVLLTGEDYNNRNQLFQNLRNRFDYKEFTTNGKMTIAAASGMAVFGKDGISYNEVFKLADERMYKNKVEMKNDNLLQ